jgi:heat shock protein 4
MSSTAGVAGIDIGNAGSCIALARKGGVDVLLNKESNRETPSVVTFTQKQRQMGTAAVGGLATNPKNTVTEIKRLMGKQFDDPEVQADMGSYPFTLCKGDGGECLVQVEYLGQTLALSPEQIMAALLVDLREIAEKEHNSSVSDVVLSVPVFYTEKERYSMLAASRIAGLNCLRLLDETTATALAYGIYKTDLPETDPLHVVFIDVGHSSTQVCVVALKKGELAVLSNAWDRNLGGRDFDKVLFDHFADEFNEKYKIDVRSNLRSSYRLMRACEKTKKVLTTNPQAPISVESLTPEVDANSMISRDVFEEKSKSILDRLLAPVQQAMDKAGLTPDKIHSVEIVGGSTRMPSVQKLIEGFFQGKEPSRTLNSKETVSRGCALQCAMLSPAFRVREFQVQDSFPYGVEFSWEKDGERVSNVVFETGSHVPCAKMLTFYRSDPFDIVARYTEDSDIPATADRMIGKWTIGAKKKGEKAKLKVKVVLTKSGVVSMESVNMIEETEVEAADDNNNNNNNNNNDDESSEQKPEATKIKTRKIAVEFKAAETGELSEEKIQKLFEAESEMALQARIQEETADAKNAVESYVYSLRNQLYEQLASFVHPDKKQEILTALDAAEEWLYDEGEDEKKSVYAAKLKEMEKLGEPIIARAKEAEARPAACQSLKHMCQDFMTRASSSELDFIPEDERNKVISECQSALAWLEEKEKLQASCAPHDDPVLLAADIAKRADTVTVFCTPILSQKKPTPPAPAPAEEEEAMDVDNEDAAAAAADANMEADNGDKMDE